MRDFGTESVRQMMIKLVSMREVRSGESLGVPTEGGGLPSGSVRARRANHALVMDRPASS